VLLSAANGGRIEVVEWLLSQGFDLAETNNNGDTCLLLAAYGGHRALCEWLLDRGVSAKEKNNCGFTPLLSAANGGQLDMVKWLINRGAKIDEADEDGYTPLILAACGGNVGMVSFFLEQGAKVTEVNENGDTPLLLAAYCGHAELVEWLLDNGASLAERNGTGMGPLISAANGGNVAVVTLLLARIVRGGVECGDGLESADQGGYTPLLLAVQRGHSEIVKLLAVHGANIQAATTRHNHGIIALAHPSVAGLCARIHGMTAIDVAADCDYLDHVHSLISEANTTAIQGALNLVQRKLHNAKVFKGNGRIQPEESTDYSLVTFGSVGAGAAGMEVAVHGAGAAVTVGPEAEEDEGGVLLVDQVTLLAERSTRHSIVKLLSMAVLPWAPCRHELFSVYDQRQVWGLVLVQARVRQTEHLPHLPQEIWFAIASFFGRTADGPLSETIGMGLSMLMVSPPPAANELTPSRPRFIPPGSGEKAREEWRGRHLIGTRTRRRISSIAADEATPTITSNTSTGAGAGGSITAASGAGAMEKVEGIEADEVGAELFLDGLGDDAFSASKLRQELFP
jgi:ankyrin repeat protein